MRPCQRQIFSQLIWGQIIFAGTVFVMILCQSWAATNESDLHIIPRSRWNATQPNLNASGEHGEYNPLTNPSGWRVYDAPLTGILKVIVIHHSALPLADGPYQIQQKHINERGFADIGYHFVINEKGEIFEGRPINVRGAHVAGHNTGAVGVVLLGNFDESIPTESQMASTKALLRYLVSTYKIPRLAGHGDFTSATTACPGQHLKELLPQLAKECGLLFGVDVDDNKPSN